MPSGLAALLVVATPLWLVGSGTLAGDRPRALPSPGRSIGFVGTAVLARPGAPAGGA